MKVYQDVTLIPDAEANLGFLWQKVFTQVHLAMVEAGRSGTQYAAAFPACGNHEFPMGNKLRLFGHSESDMTLLDLCKWLQRLQDYCHITSVRLVPNEHKHVAYRRKQVGANPERLARRRAKRKGETYEQALDYYKTYRSKKTALPYISLSSLSSEGKHEFRLYVESVYCDESIGGEFNAYGLSKTATVPWF